MLSERAIINASPLICLGKAELLHLLPLLFAEIAVPETVLVEVTANGTDRPEALAVSKAPWLTIAAPIPIDLRVASWDLGKGESSVISFAMHSSGYRPVLDDLAARRCAETLGCRVIGTAGILLRARQQQVIPSLRSAFEQLQHAGLWLSNNLVAELCQLVGE